MKGSGVRFRPENQYSRLASISFNTPGSTQMIIIQNPAANFRSVTSQGPQFDPHVLHGLHINDLNFNYGTRVLFVSDCSSAVETWSWFFTCHVY